MYKTEPYNKFTNSKSDRKKKNIFISKVDALWRF